MKNKAILAFVFALLSISCWANSPEWKRVNHIGSTIFTAIVTMDGKAVPAAAYVGAFKDGECRMIAPIIMSNDTAYVSSVIHGDIAEEMTFRLWTAPGQEKTLPGKMTTKPGESILLYKLDF